jgi:hypothetical protein
MPHDVLYAEAARRIRFFLTRLLDAVPAATLDNELGELLAGYRQRSAEGRGQEELSQIRVALERNRTTKAWAERHIEFALQTANASHLIPGGSSNPMAVRIWSCPYGDYEVVQEDLSVLVPAECPSHHVALCSELI